MIRSGRAKFALNSCFIALLLFSAATCFSRPQEIQTKKVSHGFVDNNGVRIHYASMGEGPLVVMLHGFPDYWYTWRHQMEALADQFKVVAIDLRGYNRSDKPEGVASYAMRLLIGDAAAVIQHFGAGKAVLAGHDWGGAIAWQVAMWRPDLVDRLIILSTPHPNGLMRELATNPQQQTNSSYATQFQQPGAHLNLTAEGLAGWVQENAAKQRYIEAFERSSFEGMLNYYKANYPNVTAAKQPAAAPNPPGKRITCPVLVIFGENDQYLLPAGFNGTWEWVDAPVTMVVLPGVGHFVQAEAPDRVSRTMKSWLAIERGR